MFLCTSVARAGAMHHRRNARNNMVSSAQCMGPARHAPCVGGPRLYSSRLGCSLLSLVSSLIELLPAFIHSYLGKHQRSRKALLVTCHHAASFRHGFDSNPPLGAALLDLFARCFRDHRTIWVFHSEDMRFLFG